MAPCILNLGTRFMQVASVYCGSLCSSEVSDIPYFPAHKTHRPIRCTVIFLLEILEKIMMNVF